MRHRGAPFVRYMVSTIVATDVRRRNWTVPPLAMEWPTISGDRSNGSALGYYSGAHSAIEVTGAEDRKMLKRLFTFVVAALLCGASASVLAQRVGGHGGGMGGGHGGGMGGGWHGGGGSWHGGGGNWHGGNNWHGGSWHGGSWHGGGWHNGHWYGNVSLALGFPFYWGWPYYYPYYYDPYYYAPAATYSPTYYYYSTPNAVYLDSPSGETQPYQPQAQPQARPAPSRGQYYCPDTGYYPSVQSCPKGWLRVVPDGPPPQ